MCQATATVVHAKKCKMRLLNSVIPCHKCNRKFHTKCHKIVLKNKAAAKKWTCYECSNHQRIVCEGCKKTIARSIYPVKCSLCLKNYHKVCSKIKSGSHTWTCHNCMSHELPFSFISNESLKATINGLDNITDNLINLPNFKIKTLLDKLSWNVSIQTSDFETESISSKYYAPVKFIEAKFSKNNFSILHLNIASLNAHHDEALTLQDEKYCVTGL